MIPHGGGAVPYHWGRFRGLAQELKKPLLKEHLLNNIFFDTCVYHQPGIDLLTRVIPVDNILFASEMIGAVKGHRPRDRLPLRRHQALHRGLDDLERAGPAQGLRGQRAARVPAPRCRPEGKRQVTEFQKTPGLAGLVRRPLKAALQGAGWRGRRALPCVRPGRRISLRAGAQIHALRRVEGAALCAARPSRLRPQRGGAGHLPRRRQPRDGRRAASHSGGKARGVATVRRGVTDAELAGDARRRRARRALQFRQAPGRFHAAGRADRDRRPHRAHWAGMS